MGKKLYSCNENFFRENTEQTFYIAGFIAADGCIYKPKGNRQKSLSIEISYKDHTLLSSIQQALNSNHKLYQRKRKRFNVVSHNITLLITSNKLCNDLQEIFGIGQRKSLTYSLPKKLLNHPLIHHFIRGYIDGDGSFSFSNSKRRIEKEYISQAKMSLLGSKIFLKQVRYILSNKCNTSNKQKIYKTKNIYTIYYGGNKQISNIIDILYNNATLYLKRKYVIAALSKELCNIAKAATRYSKLTIKDVKTIRLLIQQGMTIINIAKKFNVGRTTIYSIKNDEAWKDFK